MIKNKSYYDEHRVENYSHEINNTDPARHSDYKLLKNFIETYDLDDKKCLEIGSARGLFQDMVSDYTGTDIAESVRKFYRKPYFVCTDARRYPFDDSSFDAIWTLQVYEHIPELNEALKEVQRLLKPSGVLLFAPAWECTAWAAKGYPVRPYSDFNMIGKTIKLSIPVRNSLACRLLFKVPKRLLRHALYMAGHRYDVIKYKKLKANWEKYWMSDSDACNSIDTHDAILWFESNGFKCLSHPLHWKAVSCHSSRGLVFRKINEQPS